MSFSRPLVLFFFFPFRLLFRPRGGSCTTPECHVTSTKETVGHAEQRPVAHFTDCVLVFNLKSPTFILSFPDKQSTTQNLNHCLTLSQNIHSLTISGRFRSLEPFFHLAPYALPPMPSTSSKMLQTLKILRCRWVLLLGGRLLWCWNPMEEEGGEKWVIHVSFFHILPEKESLPLCHQLSCYLTFKVWEANLSTWKHQRQKETLLHEMWLHILDQVLMRCSQLDRGRRRALLFVNQMKWNERKLLLWFCCLVSIICFVCPLRFWLSIHQKIFLFFQSFTEIVPVNKKWRVKSQSQSKELSVWAWQGLILPKLQMILWTETCYMVLKIRIGRIGSELDY